MNEVSGKEYDALAMARTINHLSRLAQKQGFCNMLHPVSMAIEDLINDRIQKRGNRFFESENYRNIVYAQEVLDIFSGAVDIDDQHADKARRIEKIDEAIRFLNALRKKYATR